MTKSMHHVEIVCILDKSGSMAHITKETCAGFNEFVQEQRKLKGDAFLSLTLFNTEVEQVYSRCKLDDVGDLTEEVYCADGMTALLDAMGETLTKVKSRIVKSVKSKRPKKVIVLIVTDGLENASKEWKKDSIRGLVADLQDNHKWKFVFLGANQDSIQTCDAYGINTEHAANYKATRTGVMTAYSTATASTTTIRETRV